MQLYSVEQNRSQALEAHTAAFSHLTLNGTSTNVIAFSTKTFTNGAVNSKIHVIALGGSHKKQAELFFPEGFSDDFPVSMQIRYAPVTEPCVLPSRSKVHFKNVKERKVSTIRLSSASRDLQSDSTRPCPCGPPATQPCRQPSRWCASHGSMQMRPGSAKERAAGC